MGIADLPALNAVLNGTSAAFLVAGYVLIRRGRIEQHKRCMLAALATSALFLVSYVVYHAPTSAHGRFRARGPSASYTSASWARTWCSPPRSSPSR
jgi:uncharacterized membrane protein YozB (DUF420 family)